MPAMLAVKQPQGGVRVIPQLVATALAKRLQASHGCQSYRAVQQWLAETLGVEAAYHAVDQMTCHRLKAKLKVAHPGSAKQVMITVSSSRWSFQSPQPTWQTGSIPTFFTSLQQHAQGSNESISLVAAVLS
ncbi:hypothetical protein H6F76_05440 [Leptolyngbya sp. FACHB-321]|uniref:hypothetical protein n=1 Tax=Leptolyngbya sp. FACHB-321 TaxID=2692807 RepID=UPI0019BF77A8|nr:hypothetical protein [Leptolyngbya sp. FACHB-321]MBD2034477.1 hypothetical protein [Leptolyngbya sp. FACHB-321]